jgi:hypothetical protein
VFVNGFLIMHLLFLCRYRAARPSVTCWLFRQGNAAKMAGRRAMAQAFNGLASPAQVGKAAKIQPKDPLVTGSNVGILQRAVRLPPLTAAALVMTRTWWAACWQDHFHRRGPARLPRVGAAHNLHLPAAPPLMPRLRGGRWWRATCASGWRALAERIPASWPKAMAS